MEGSRHFSLPVMSTTVHMQPNNNGRSVQNEEGKRGKIADSAKSQVEHPLSPLTETLVSHPAFITIASEQLQNNTS